MCVPYEVSIWPRPVRRNLPRFATVDFFFFFFRVKEMRGRKRKKKTRPLGLQGAQGDRVHQRSPALPLWSTLTERD